MLNKKKLNKTKELSKRKLNTMKNLNIVMMKTSNMLKEDNRDIMTEKSFHRPLVYSKLNSDCSENTLTTE